MRTEFMALVRLSRVRVDSRRTIAIEVLLTRSNKIYEILLNSLVEDQFYQR
jgi:hypothetical protein